MGRRKISIQPIDDKKIRYSTYNKRKNGLVKKAAELSMLCDVKMLLVFEDLNGELVRYSTHGIYEPAIYFKQAWSNCERSFTSSDYPDFYKVKPYKKVLERREKKQKAEARLAGEQTDSEDSDDEPLEVPAKDVKTIKEKVAYIPKAKRELTNVEKIKKTALEISKGKVAGNHALVGQVKNAASTETRVSPKTGSPAENTLRDVEKTISEQIKSEELKFNMNDKGLSGLSGFMGNNMMGLDHLNLDQFYKPSGFPQRLDTNRDNYAAPLSLGMSGEGQAPFQKNFYESYMQYLDDANNMLKSIDVTNGMKMMPSYYPIMAQTPAMNNLFGFNGNGYNARDYSYAMEEPYTANMQFETNNLNMHLGHEANKRVKKE